MYVVKESDADVGTRVGDCFQPVASLSSPPVSARNPAT